VLFASKTRKKMYSALEQPIGGLNFEENYPLSWSISAEHEERSFSFNLYPRGEILRPDMKVAAGRSNDGRSPPKLPSHTSDFE